MNLKHITPEQLAFHNTEDGHQLAFFCWCALNYKEYPELKWAFHVPNGGFRHKAEAAKLRAMGVRSGVPDICLPVRRGSYSGLFIELKRMAKDGKREGRLSDNQKEVWIPFLKSQGFGVAVAYGWMEARNIIVSYLNWSDNAPT